MLEIVSKGFKNAKAALTGRTQLTADNIQQALRDIRVSLLEADVEVGVVRTFLKRVQDRALGEVVNLDVKKGAKKKVATPGEHFVLICHHELEKLMGPVEEKPIIFRRPYTLVMMVGLQGTGKTTTCGKLAAYLLNDARKPLLVAADVYRPAAVEQLKILGERLGVPVFSDADLSPPQLCLASLKEAKQHKRDVVIFDTAGRLAIDDVLMAELEEIKALTHPDHIFLVCDAMAGQDTVRTAGAFNQRLDMSGFIITKLDGDARGGAALSIKEITGKPIKFVGTGESLDKLEPFRPEGLASRILGMGDIVGLMHDFEQVVDEKQAERSTRKMLKGQFTLEDFLGQLRMLQKMGSVQELYEKFPLFGDAQPPAGTSLQDNTLVMMEAIIQSMTAQERQTPHLINDSRARRIALGAGRKPEEVKDLISRFHMMQGMVGRLAKQPGLLRKIPGLKQIAQMRHMKGQGMADIFGARDPLARRRGFHPRPADLDGDFNDPSFLAEQSLMSPKGSPLAMPEMGMQGPYPPDALQGFSQPPPGGPRPLSAKQKVKSKEKRKAERKARKKSRR